MKHFYFYSVVCIAIIFWLHLNHMVFNSTTLHSLKIKVKTYLIPFLQRSQSILFSHLFVQQDNFQFTFFSYGPLDFIYSLAPCLASATTIFSFYISAIIIKEIPFILSNSVLFTLIIYSTSIKFHSDIPTVELYFPQS